MTLIEFPSSGELRRGYYVHLVCLSASGHASQPGEWRPASDRKQQADGSRGLRTSKMRRSIKQLLDRKQPQTIVVQSCTVSMLYHGISMYIIICKTVDQEWIKTRRQYCNIWNLVDLQLQFSSLFRLLILCTFVYVSDMFVWWKSRPMILAQ